MHKALPALLVMLFCLSGLAAVELTKQPTRAMLYSAIVPGGGQLYNQSYLKAGLVAGLQAYLVTLAVHDADKAGHYQDLMDNVGNDDLLLQTYETRRDSYREELRSDYWWMGTVLLMSVADAFVDAHLYNFKQEKRNIMLRFTDTSMQLEVRF